MPTASRLSPPLATPFTLSWQQSTLTYTTPRRTTRGLHYSRPLYTISCSRTGHPTTHGEACPIPQLSPEYQDHEQFTRLLTQACDHVTQLQQLPPQLYCDQSSIRFALESSLLRAHAADKPIWDTPFTRGEAPIPIHHLIWMDTLPHMLQQADEGVSAGFTCLKLKIGTHPWDQELSLLTHLRHQHPHIELRVDANGSLPLPSAHTRLQQLAALDIAWIEQPLPPSCYHELRSLIASSPIPIALDEQLIGINTPENIEKILTDLRPHGLVLKPSLHGGLSTCELLIHHAHSLGIHCWVNSMLESSLGLSVLAEWTSAMLPNQLHALSKGKLYCQQDESADFPSCQLRGNSLVYVV